MNAVAQPIDAQRLTLILNDLRLPAIKQAWPRYRRTRRQESLAGRFLAALAEHEIAERDLRRIERHLGKARLPPGKPLDRIAFDAVPMVSKAKVIATCSGDGRLESPSGGSDPGWRSSRMAGACFSPAPPISPRGSRSQDASSSTTPRSSR